MSDARTDPATTLGRYPATSEDLLARARAIEQLLIERGAVGSGTIARIVDRYERDIGPLLGAKVIARAWADERFRERLLRDATAACRELGIGGMQGEHLVALPNEPGVHHVVVCTLCSCYPWPVLGLPPSWYKDPEYRARVVAEPRAVLREFGLELGRDVEIRVVDTSAEVRYFVLPERPAGSEGFDEERLAALVTRDCMVGVAVPEVGA